MGEYAEMMLDGTCCEGCGEYLGDASGFPRYCSSCRPRERRSGDEPFFLRGKKGLKDLEHWLAERKFNCGGYFRDDKRGNPMVSIGYDWKPESDWSMPDKRGLIIILAKDLLPEVEAMVQKMAGTTP